MSAALLARAVRGLAEVCDHATTEDGRGFNGTDASFGHRLAALDPAQWTPENQRAAWEMLGKYRKQLGGMGIDFDAIDEPTLSNGSEASRRTAREGDVWAVEEIVLRFPYDAKMVDYVKAIPGRRFDGASKSNTVPLSSAAHVIAFMKAFPRNWQITDEARAVLLQAARAARDDGAGEGGVGTGRSVDVEDGKFAVVFPYDPEMVNAMRMIRGRVYDGSRKANIVSEKGAAELAIFLDRFEGFTVSAEAQRMIAELTAREEARGAQAEEMVALSRAHDSSMEMPELGGTLLPFQRAGIEYVVKAEGRAFLGDEQGIGKTVQALGAAQLLDAFPLVVVCPASVKLSWRNHVQGPAHSAPNGWLPGKRVAVLEGRKASLRKLHGAEVIVLNWDILAAWAPVLKEAEPRGLVFDESHYAKSPGAGRTKAAIELSKAIPSDGLILNLTGTAILNRPIELVTQLRLIGHLRQFGGRSEFGRRYCQAEYDGYRWDYNGASNTEELNERLRASCFCRRTKVEVLPQLPAKQIASVPVTLSNRREYERAEQETIKFLVESVQRDQTFAEELKAYPAHERAQKMRERQNETAERARRAERLVQLNLLRKVCALGKIRSGVEWVSEFLDSTDKKLIMFAHHVEVQKALLEPFDCATRIFGEDSSAKRGEAVERFQTDPSCRLIVCSLQAAREGITLTAASDVGFLELGWTPAGHEQAEDRAHRIGQEDSVNCSYLLAEGTIDEMMNDLLEQKREVTTAVTDGKATSRGLSVQAGLEAALLAKAGL